MFISPLAVLSLLTLLLLPKPLKRKTRSARPLPCPPSAHLIAGHCQHKRHDFSCPQGTSQKASRVTFLRRPFQTEGWWCVFLITMLRRQSQEDLGGFEASLIYRSSSRPDRQGYTGRVCLKKPIYLLMKK